LGDAVGDSECNPNQSAAGEPLLDASARSGAGAAARPVRWRSAARSALGGRLIVSAAIFVQRRPASGPAMP
jgi:hypothetical protein